MTKTRVLVVEDSLTVRKYLADVLRADPELDVIAEAEDGKQAIELCKRLRPDVITLDMMLPHLSGLAATEYIMAYCPTPIVIVSASTNRGELFRTYDALAAGAVDVLEKSCAIGDAAWERHFVSTVKLVARVKVITHPRARLRSLHSAVTAFAPASTTAEKSLGNRGYQCVAVGASTGGPQALAAILGALPADFPLPILLVMHISPAFGGAFAEWLNNESRVPVATAIHGEPLPPVGSSRVVLAPPDRHLVVGSGRLWLTPDAEVHSCRPSVDVLFESVAQEIGGHAIGVLLTGMGRDGARGLLAVRQAGGMTLAQDEATSVVFGMPRQAIQLDAARRILPLGDVAVALTTLAGTAVNEGNDHESPGAHRR